MFKCSTDVFLFMLCAPARPVHSEHVSTQSSVIPGLDRVTLVTSAPWLVLCSNKAEDIALPYDCCYF